MSFKPQSIAILGRQPALGIAELESLYGAGHITPFGSQACFLALADDEIDFPRLGGSVRLARQLAQLPGVQWSEIEKYLLEKTPEHAQYIDGKLSFGISVYGVNVSPKRLAKTALSVKKAIKAAGRSVRMVPHGELELGSATVLYNKLTAQNGWELLVVSDGKTAYLAQTSKVQDIDAYAARDQARPARDAKVGMLPPKLAQIIVNLAVGSNEVKTLLDPFCGTGVVLQEALLMDYEVYGSDLDPRMVEYTDKNLDWFVKKFRPLQTMRRLEVADATTYQWVPQTFSTVACETFLGKPLGILPPSDQLSKIMHEANYINHRFLQNLSSQLQKGWRICVAVPVWRGKHEFLHLPALDHLTDMGYTVVRFKHVNNQDLIYHREGQVVGRELLVLEKR